MSLCGWKLDSSTMSICPCKGQEPGICSVQENGTSEQATKQPQQEAEGSSLESCWCEPVEEAGVWCQLDEESSNRHTQSGRVKLRCWLYLGADLLPLSSMRHLSLLLSAAWIHGGSFPFSNCPTCQPFLETPQWTCLEVCFPSFLCLSIQWSWQSRLTITASKANMILVFRQDTGE